MKFVISKAPPQAGPRGSSPEGGPSPHFVILQLNLELSLGGQNDRPRMEGRTVVEDEIVFSIETVGNAVTITFLSHCTVSKIIFQLSSLSVHT